ncbi:dihydrofolate reductase [Novacetimonas maltaceti]|uniref:Glyoxylate/hydroxypyruvate reductase B n=1 Tax=Novacetimonas maltaceti TaxID=1203393 RepID=A0A2S3VZH6_9PROT|nr:2-hydroxyacid dehydrogenase [Novacetimonas maltaceti]POF61988.1 Glyoxylate/hydroxypyruvate reductase B [Novacetimonas maltaceti]PYD59124.1 dihydrofolate reductase [Novacetimonas maltaceti]
MKPDIVLLERMMPPIEKALDAAYTVHYLPDMPSLEAIAPRVRAVVTGGGTGVPPDVMAALPELGLIAINGIGTDAVDLQAARRRNIHVTTTPGVLTDDVADMAIALLLAASRGIVRADRYVREGEWPKGAPIALGHRVSGRRMGIVGLGHVGRAIAHRAQAFGMQVAYNDVREIPDAGLAFHASLTDLARCSDILVVAAAGGAGSRGIVNEGVLDALGSAGLLINVARGSVVDESALVAALRDGRLGGAGLDVFAHEPDVPAALLAMDNVVLQPHRASATVETRQAMGEMVLGNLAAFHAGRPLLSAVV